MRETGYLYLATEAGRSGLEACHALQRRHGADVALLDPAELRHRFPWLVTDGLALGSLGLSGEGSFDGYGLLRAFRRKASAQGAALETAEVVGVELSTDRVDAVRLRDGRALPCDVCGQRRRPLGGPGRRHGRDRAAGKGAARSVFVLDCPDPPAPCPS